MKQTRKSSLVLLAGISGNLMEWYDFGLYGVLAATLSKLFFPDKGGFIGLLSVYGVFAAGYIARVAGGTLFGHIGDRFGRRSALLISAMVMALATFFVGCLPTFATLGVMAPVLFTIFRLLQGLSVGGEFTTSLSFMIEHAPEKRRAFQGSFASMSATSGILIGSATGNLLFSIFTTEQILEWAWRIPFLLSLPMGIVIMVLRRVLPADPPIQEVQHAPSPLVRVVREHPVLIVRGILLGWGPAVAFYMTAVFLSSFLATGHYLDQKTSLMAQTLAIAVIIACTPISGLLADFAGRKIIVLMSSMACLVFAYPFFRILESGNISVDYITIVAFAVMLAIGFSPYQVWLAEQFPSNLRTSGLGMAYNIAVGVFGGTTPLLATSLVEITGNPMAPAALIVVSSLTSVAVAFFMKETGRQPLR